MHASLGFERKAFDLRGRTRDNLIVQGISKEKRGWRVVMKERLSSLFLQPFELNTFFEDIPNLGYGDVTLPLTVSACSGRRSSFWCRGLRKMPAI